jgi:hypothetical protein
MSALEERLSRIDLQLASVGGHIDDERLALIVQGVEPTNAEAGHLAGCDACTELLITVGVGFEAALATLPDAAEWAQPPAPPGSSTPWGVWLGGSGLLISAVALWVALGGNAPEPSVAPTAVAPATAQMRTPPQTSRASTVSVAQTGRSVSNTPSVLPEAPPSTAPTAPATRARPSGRPDGPQTARLEPQRLKLRGPRPLDSRPVDGPPQGSGFLRLNAKPSAKVYLDGKFIGWTPLIDHRLLAGPHDVRLEYTSPRARVAEERFRVVIEPDLIWRSVRRNLKPSPP